MYIVNMSSLMSCDEGYHADASELGFAPGEWPGKVSLDSEVYVLDIVNEDLARYTELGGSRKLIVWND